MSRKKTSPSTTETFEKLAASSPELTYVLRLYVAGNNPMSSQAIMNIREICEQRLKGRYQLEVIDIYQQTALAKGEQIIAVPTLIKYLPLPLKRIIGDLSKTDRVIFGLDLRLHDDEGSPDESPTSGEDHPS
jgi:circadian clock protein KaiB